MKASDENTPHPVTNRDGARNTLVLATFSTLANLADGVMKLALPLLATNITDSPSAIAAVAMTLTLPWLVAALPVGSLIDRTNRRGALIVANGVRMLALVALLVAVLNNYGGLWLLYSAGIVLGLAEVVALTAAAAIVPQAVPAPGRDRANSWLAATETVCGEFCGPVVGGLLVAAGTTFALGATTTAFAISMLIPIMLRGSFGVAKTQNQDQPRGGSGAGHVFDGFRFLWSNRLLRTMALTLTVLCFSWGAWLAMMPLFLTKLSGASPFEYGLVMSSLGLGGLVGAGLTTSLNKWFGRRLVMLADLVGTLVMVGVPIFVTTSWAISVAAFCGGLGGTLWSVNSRTLTQAVVPQHLMGRFHAAWRLLSWGALPLGSGAVGVLAEFFGMQLAFVPCAVLVGVMVIPFLLHITPAAIKDAEDGRLSSV